MPTRRYPVVSTPSPQAQSPPPPLSIGQAPARQKPFRPTIPPPLLRQAPSRFRQSLSAPFDNATGTVTPAATGSSSVVPNAIATPDTDQSTNYTAQDLMVGSGTLTDKQFTINFTHKMGLAVPLQRSEWRVPLLSKSRHSNHPLVQLQRRRRDAGICYLTHHRWRKLQRIHGEVAKMYTINQNNMKINKTVFITGGSTGIGAAPS